MAYHLAPSLVVLRGEIDARWPGRDKGSDGWIGDAAHQKGQSDHNPNRRESVNALDVDKDGIDPQLVIRKCVAHPSTEYVIFDRQIWTRSNGFRSVRYTGSNPHDKHLHVSVRQSAAAEQDRRPWGIAGEDEDMAFDDEQAKRAWATTKRAEALLAGTDARYRVPGEKTDRVEPNHLAKALAELRTQVEALADRPTTGPVELDYDELARALLRAAARGPAS